MSGELTAVALGIRPLRVAMGAALALAAAAAGAQSLPSDFTLATRYDKMRRVVGTIAPDPDGNGPLHHMAVRNSYDAAGRLWKVEKGELAAWQSEAVAPSAWSGFTIFQTVETSFDSMDRKTREALSDQSGTRSVTEYGYDGLGRVVCTAVRMNPAQFATPLPNKCIPGPAGTQGPDRIERAHYTPTGEVSQIRRGVGTPLEQGYATYTYTPNGKRASVTDANGNRAEMTYDPFDLQSRWIFPSKTVPGAVNPADYEEYTYDKNGNRKTLRKRDGSTLAFDYDALNRMTRKVVPERAGLTAAQTRDVYYSYDLRGLQTGARFDSFTGEGIHTEYDGFGRIKTTGSNMGGVDRSLTASYDAGSNRTRLLRAGEYDLGVTFDGLNRPLALKENGGAGDFIHRFTYDAQGRHGFQLVGPNGAASTGYGYDGGLPRLSSLTHAFPGESQAYGFTYNAASQIVTASSSIDAFTWTGGVNVARPYAVNGLNQYLNAGAVNFTYDANGNLISDGSTTYVYDVENRLVSASGAKTASLVYDPLGRLFQTSGGSAGITRFEYDGDQLINEFDGANTRLRAYAHGPGADDPVIWYEFPGGYSRRYLHANHQGSIVGISGEYGHLTAVNTYDEYGIPGANNLGRFGYTGQTWIPELGMNYYKARIYSPTLGRFMQTDPVGYDDQVNLYAYVGNDPVNGTDSTGTREERGREVQEGRCSNTPRNASGCSSSDGGPQRTEGKPKVASTSRSQQVAAGALAVAGVLAADDATGIGVADDPLIPVALVVAGVATLVAPDSTSEVHANSHNSDRPNEVYYLINRRTAEIDKIGCTCNPDSRYSQAWLRANGVDYFTVQRYRSRYPAKVHENIALVHYFQGHGRLPRLNKVFW